MVNKIKKIWKNKWLILEGVFNYYFTRKKIARIAAQRNAICRECPLIDLKGTHCEVPGTQPCCSECGCSLKYKTHSMSSSCPVNKWSAMMTEEEEDNLNAKINIDEFIDIEPNIEASKNIFKPLHKLGWNTHYPDEQEIFNQELTNELIPIPNACEDACILESFIPWQAAKRHSPSHRFALKTYSVRHILVKALNNETLKLRELFPLLEFYIEYPSKSKQWCRMCNADIDKILFNVLEHDIYNYNIPTVNSMTFGELYEKCKDSLHARCFENEGDDLSEELLFACVPTYNLPSTRF